MPRRSIATVQVAVDLPDDPDMCAEHRCPFFLIACCSLPNFLDGEANADQFDGNPRTRTETIRTARCKEVFGL